MADFDLARLAHHEAGHAVVHYVFNVDAEIRLEPNGSGMTSVVPHDPPPPLTKALLRAILAGAEADKVLCKGNPEALERCKRGWEGDYDSAKKVMEGLEGHWSIEDATAESANLVAKHWNAICGLAKALIHASSETLDRGDQYYMPAHEVKRFIEATQEVVEVWHDGKFLATITGMEGPGVKIVTKHTLAAKPTPDDASGVHVMEVSIAAS